jgi:YwiC-like protein
MLPKEHGAYGQLIFPLITALAIGRPTIGALAIAAAAVFLFLGHEPLLVLLGQRGPRAAREQRGRALAWFGASGTVAAVCGVFALVTINAGARVTLAIPAALGAIVVIVIVARGEHTLGGEVLSAMALASVAYPIGVASTASFRASLSTAAAFAATFVIGVVCVHGVIARTRRPPAAIARTVGALVAVAISGLTYRLAAIRVLEVITPLAVAPAALAGLALVAVPPSARRLRLVGWTLVATSTLTALILLAAFR